MSNADSSILDNHEFETPGGGQRSIALTVPKKASFEHNEHNRKRHRDDSPSERSNILKDISDGELVSAKQNDVLPPQKVPKVGTSLVSESSEDEPLTLLNNQVMVPKKPQGESPHISDVQVDDKPNLVAAQCQTPVDDGLKQANSSNAEQGFASKDPMPQVEKERNEDEQLFSPSKKSVEAPKIESEDEQLFSPSKKSAEAPKIESEDEQLFIPSKKSVEAPKIESDDKPAAEPSKMEQEIVKPMKKPSEKKVASSKGSKSKYDMPGQKKPTPSELNGARIFYESLWKQNPESKMAKEYLLKFGLLPYELALTLVEEQRKLKAKTKPPPTKKPNKNVTKKKKQRKTKKKAERKKKTKKSTKKKRTKVMQMESGESSSDESLSLKTKDQKDTKKSEVMEKPKIVMQMESGESSSDENIIMKPKDQKDAKKSESKENLEIVNGATLEPNSDESHAMTKEAKFDNFLDNIS